MTARRALLQLTAGAVLIGLSGLAKARAANGLVALVHTRPPATTDQSIA